jgi:hypothetical protein
LASQSYNEGIDLKAVRHIHIFEPLITWASDKQTIGRAARLCSHSDLNKKDWNVTIHRYISNFPTKDIKLNANGVLDKTSLLNEIKLGEEIDYEYKKKLKEDKDMIREIKKNITKTKKAKQSIVELEKELEYYNNEIEKGKKNIEDIKKELKTLNAALKKIMNEKTKKKKYDATGVENIDQFIYNNAISKMQNILTLYQTMKEAAIDCRVLKEFHSSGNQIINCYNY